MFHFRIPRREKNFSRLVDPSRISAQDEVQSGYRRCAETYIAFCQLIFATTSYDKEVMHSNGNIRKSAYSLWKRCHEMGPNADIFILSRPFSLMQIKWT